MIIRIRILPLLALASLCLASPPPDPALPVSALIASANALLAQGDMHGALSHFDAAIKKDPSNYLTIFKRGATYLSLGRSPQASADFDAVLALKPDFEAALLQRARLRARGGDWGGARGDYRAAGAGVEEVDGAERAAASAVEAEKRGEWERCVADAGTAIVVAAGMPSLRSMRARCRLERGEILEAVGDLTHVAQLNPSSLDVHIQIAALLYYAGNDYDRATAQLRKCLHSDPDSKPCSRAFRRLKSLHKAHTHILTLHSTGQHTAAARALTGTDGLIPDIQSDTSSHRASGHLPPTHPEPLLSTLLDLACDILPTAPGRPYCDSALTHNPHSLPALLALATRQLSSDDFEGALRTLATASEQHPGDPRVASKTADAQTRLRRSKIKDYYKVLDVPRDATHRQIRAAWRRKTKEWHPDKYRGDLTKEAVEKKMSAVNEAYEVLGSEELRTRFDNGEDPMSSEPQAPPGWGHGGGGHPFAGGFGGGGGQQYMFRQGAGGFGGGGGGFGGQGGFKFQF